MTLNGTTLSHLPPSIPASQNTFNHADHAISNNTLEMWLQILQGLQLSFGLTTLVLKLPDWAVTTVYMLIVRSTKNARSPSS